MTTRSAASARDSTASAISAAVSTATTSTPGAAGRPDVVTRVTCAPARGGFGQSVALPSRGAVREVANRVDGLPGAPCGNEHAPARKRKGTSRHVPGRRENPGRLFDDRVGLRKAVPLRGPRRPSGRSPARGRERRVGAVSPDSPGPRRAPTSRCAWKDRRALGHAWRAASPRAGPRKSQPRTPRSRVPSPVRSEQGRAPPELGVRDRDSLGEQCQAADSEASAENVASPTNRVALAVRTGTTWDPASTKRRQSSTAL